MMKRNTFLFTLLTFSHVTFAESLSYDFVQLGFVDNQMAGLEEFEQTGPEIQFSATVFENVFVKGRYRNVDDSITGQNGLKHTVEERNWQFGVGYVFNINPQTNIDTSVNVGRFAIDLDTGTEIQRGDSNHHSIAANVRQMLTSNVELSGGLEWQFWEGSLEQKAYQLGAMYHYSDLSFGAQYTKYSDFGTCSIFARYAF
ncbi:MAG: hypothetical protein HWE26_13420 [Alteromonadaceae bacterium]|nr:hypothetical protein [Alteromonadaceae bacterium]